MAEAAPRVGGALGWIDRAGIWLALLLPLFLLHGRVFAEVLFVALGLLFLLQSWMRRDWAWLRQAWVRLGVLWWAWVVVCSLPHGVADTGQALGAGRFPLAVAALEHWALRDGWVRTWLGRLLRWAALYIALQCALQFATGRNLFGYGRGADGELTGPYENPRAAAPLSRLLFPAVLPVLDRWTRAGRAWAGALLLLGSVGTVVLIGQRMPLLLTGLGLVTTALLLPRLRRFVLATGVLAVLLVGATATVSPPTFKRLVTKFSVQMEDFPRSHYGLIARRAVNIAEASPVLGAGFDGFRRECDNPAYFHGIDGEGGGAAMCVQHPHNFFLQALVEGGYPGLLLFTGLVAAWLARLGRGLWHNPEPLRAGLFVAALLHVWPVASTTAFTSMPQSGWFFVLLGLGLAETRHYMSARIAGATPNV